MAQTVLTLNAGSSSIKVALFKVGQDASLGPAFRGDVDGIGTRPRFVVRDAAGTILTERSWSDPQPGFDALLGAVLGWTDSHVGGDGLSVVGHRVVHGGPEHGRPERVTPQLLEALDRLIPLAPLHEPHNLAPMRAIAVARPALAQVACFDTAFHRTLDATTARLALPRRFEADGMRRYGFHGLSYEYVSLRLRDVAPELGRGRVIVAHLGNGASLCALRGGVSVDTTMSFTALDGLVMGTRCGALDPGAVLYLQQRHGLTPDEVQDLLYKESGLLGVSGISSDMRDLLASSEPQAREAVELFVFSVARHVGALISSLGGLDGLVFTAGIGEGAPEIRALVCSRLAWLGIALNPAANDSHAPVISTSDSRVQVRVIPTDEEAMIARHALDVLRSATLRPPVAPSPP